MLFFFQNENEINKSKVTSHFSGIEDIGNEHHVHANVSILKQLLFKAQLNEKDSMKNITLIST